MSQRVTVAGDLAKTVFQVVVADSRLPSSAALATSR
jgi:ribosomal protein S16